MSGTTIATVSRDVASAWTALDLKNHLCKILRVTRFQLRIIENGQIIENDYLLRHLSSEVIKVIIVGLAQPDEGEQEDLLAACMVSNLRVLTQLLEKPMSPNFWLDLRTHRNLRDAAVTVIMLCLHGHDELVWPTLDELRIESRFGRCRTQFANSQMTVSDYWRASAKLMRGELKTWTDSQKTADPQTGSSREEKVSAREFQAAASRAMTAGVKFACMASGMTLEEIQSLHNMHFNGPGDGGGLLEGDDEDDAGAHMFGKMTFKCQVFLIS